MPTASETTTKSRWAACVYLCPPEDMSGDPRDITRHEMSTRHTELRGLPLRLEHMDLPGDIGKIVDTVIDPATGSTFVVFEIDESDKLGKDAADNIRANKHTGVSLSHWADSRAFKEVSLVMTPARAGCHIIDAKEIRKRVTSSSKPVFASDVLVNCSSLEALAKEMMKEVCAVYLYFPRPHAV